MADKVQDVEKYLSRLHEKAMRNKSKKCCLSLKMIIEIEVMVREVKQILFQGSNRISRGIKTPENIAGCKQKGVSKI